MTKKSEKKGSPPYRQPVDFRFSGVSQQRTSAAKNPIGNSNNAWSQSIKNTYTPPTANKLSNNSSVPNASGGSQNSSIAKSDGSVMTKSYSNNSGGYSEDSGNSSVWSSSVKNTYTPRTAGSEQQRTPYRRTQPTYQTPVLNSFTSGTPSANKPFSPSMPQTIFGNITGQAGFNSSFDSLQKHGATSRISSQSTPPKTKLGEAFGNNSFSPQMLTWAKEAAEREKTNIFIPNTRITDGDKATSEKIPDFRHWLGDNVMNGVGQFNRGLANTVDFILPTAGDFGGDSIMDRVIDYYKNDSDRLQQQASKTNEIKGGNWKTAGEYVSQTTAAVPQAIIASMTGGAAIGRQSLSSLQSSGLGNTIISSAQKLMKNPMFWSSFVQTTGNSYENAKKDGANDIEAISAAMITGLLDAGVEVGGGIDTLPGKERLIRNWVRGMLEEGEEEVVQGIIDNEVQKIIYDQSKPFYSSSDYDAVISPQRAKNEFQAGATVGGILGAGQMGAGMIVDPYRAVNAYMFENMPDEEFNDYIERIMDSDEYEIKLRNEKYEKYKNSVDYDPKSDIIIVDRLDGYIGRPVIQTDNQHVREWYVANVRDIPNQVDKTLPFERQVYQAYELRNQYKHEARVAMSDVETANWLETRKPAPTFEYLLHDKMNRKNMTIEEALQDIYITASKTNADVNDEFGLGGY